MSPGHSPLEAASRPLIIDALNLAYWCGPPATLRIPLGLMAGLIERGHPVTLVFDASAPHQLRPEVEIYQQLLAHPACVADACVVEVRSGIPADRVMLRQASASGACIVSRDRFGDHRRRHRRLIDDPARLISGHIAADRIHLPTLALDLTLPPSTDCAWARLRPLLNHVAAP